MVKHYSNEHSNISDNPKLRYLIVKPHTHEDWLIERCNGIGASEAAKAIDCSRYGSRYSLWRDKLGLNPPVEENWAMKSGHIYEKEVALIFEKELGFKVIKNTEGDWIAADRKKPYLRVSPDRVYWLKNEDGTEMPHNLFNRGILECKTSSKHYTPECIHNECISWFCQVQYQLHVMGLENAYLGFLCTDSLSGGDYWFEKIDYNKKFCEEILIPALTDIWVNHIVPAKEYLSNGLTEENIRLANVYAPEITDADDITTRYPTQDADNVLDASELTMPDDNKETFLEQLSIYLQLRDRKKAIEEEMSGFESAVRLLMKDADSIVGDDGKALITFRQNKSSMKLDSKRFKEENPELYASYCKEQQGARVLKIK